MFRPLLCLLAVTALAACTTPPALTPVPLPAPGPEAAPPAAPTDAPVEPSAADPAQMAAACRNAAAGQLNVAAAAVSLSPAEETSLGFVVFGEATGSGGSARPFECSFGRDGALRVVRAA
ncbi:MAG: hypothetical protein NXH97_10780 [Rhodobacteraceae bacterium]|nr:hypothetical protein [Paracoccaceae bacterium]